MKGLLVCLCFVVVPSVSVCKMTTSLIIRIYLYLYIRLYYTNSNNKNNIVGACLGIRIKNIHITFVLIFMRR